MKQAKYWHNVLTGVQCDLCPQGCLLKEGQTGRCRVRTVENSRLMAAGYGLVSSSQLDPIEKKPLHHFHPGEQIFSIGGWGCNLACSFCQNWSISQEVMRNGRRLTPDEIVGQAEAVGSIGIAYTYNEPLIAIEFVGECAKLAHDMGLLNVLVTNGYVNPAPAADLLAHVNALNIDIKSMDEDFYTTNCKGTLQPALDFAVQAIEAGCHVEITNLLIPGLNDDAANLGKLACWIREHLGVETPLHISAYRPQYKMSRPATPFSSLREAYDICKQHLLYVYLGNVMSVQGQETECPQCGTTLISRCGYSTKVTGIANNACENCGRPADVVC